jgi:hypothetical protein
MTRALVACVLASFVSGCVTAQVAVPPTEASALERSLVGEKRFLRTSMYQTPFFGDATRRLLTPYSPELVRLLNDTGGKPINPGAVEKTFAVGTPLKITKVEFPTAWAMTERVLYTPRTLVWVTVELENAPRGGPLTVLVLRPGIKSQQEFLAELDHALTREDPTLQLDGFSEAVRDAVKTKRALKDMPAEALEMAWGYPESKRIELDGQTRKETWKWGDGARTAVVVDGKLASFTGASDASSSSSP